jgi:hypothetical protein
MDYQSSLVIAVSILVAAFGIIGFIAHCLACGAVERPQTQVQQDFRRLAVSKLIDLHERNFAALVFLVLLAWVCGYITGASSMKRWQDKYYSSHLAGRLSDECPNGIVRWHGPGDYRGLCVEADGIPSYVEKSVAVAEYSFSPDLWYKMTIEPMSATEVSDGLKAKGSGLKCQPD